MLKKIAAVLGMIKVQHSLFALPWAFAAAFTAAEGAPPWDKILWILTAMVAARSAAMAFNRIADAKLDAENPRTKDRAIPAGRVSAAFTATFTLAMSALFLFAAWNLNDLCFRLAPVALAVTFAYSYTKRFTALCHWVLGLSHAIAPLGAWLAVRPEWHPLPLLLGAAAMFWIAGADILYACEDLEFDRRRGLKSVPAAIGLKGAMVVSALSHAATVAALVAAGVAGRLGAPFHAAVAGIAALLVYEHAIVRPADLRLLNRAFFHVNAAVGAAVLAGVLGDIFLR